jgi:hypothetical protein
MKMYKEKLKDGQEVVRFEHTESKAEFKQQLNQFETEAKKGKVICLSDLMINAGM